MTGNPINFRRLSAFRTISARTSCIFRSASLDDLSSEAAWRLRYRLGINTFVDLHNGPSVTRNQSISEVGIRHLHRPIRTVMPSPQIPYPSAEDYAEYYAHVLAQCGADFAIAFYEVARAAPEGVVFACRQGKDRTGLLAAALQQAVGLRVDTILGDFARSGPALIRAADRHRTSWEKRNLNREEYLHRYTLGAAPLVLLESGLGGYGSLLRRIITAAPSGLNMDNAIDTLCRLRART